MTETSNEIPDQDEQIFSLRWGGDFTDTINDLYSLENIKETAQKIIALEQERGAYELGKFNRYLLPNYRWDKPNMSWDRYESDFMKIPEAIRQRASEVIRANLHSASPLPIFNKVSENVDPVHDIIVKPFVYSQTLYLGILYLCPNPKQPGVYRGRR